MTKRCGIYTRVSTSDKNQTCENQERELRALAEHRGWEITKSYTDLASGSKGRDKRPGLDGLLKDAARGRLDVALVWAVDRLGRSLPDLISTMQELHNAKVDLVLLQQGIDTTAPAGKAMFQMLGVFAEFERSMIVARVRAGIDRAKAEQAAGIKRYDHNGRLKKRHGRPPVDPAKLAQVQQALADGMGYRAVELQTGVSARTAARIKQMGATP